MGTAAANAKITASPKAASVEAIAASSGAPWRRSSMGSKARASASTATATTMTQLA